MAGKELSFQIKLNTGMVRAVRDFCRQKGFRIGAFVAKAIEERMGREEFLEDRDDLIRLRYEEGAARPAEEYFKKRGV